MDPIQWKLDIIFLLLICLGMALLMQGRRISEILSRSKELKRIAEAGVQKSIGTRFGLETLPGGRKP